MYKIIEKYFEIFYCAFDYLKQFLRDEKSIQDIKAIFRWRNANISTRDSLAHLCRQFPAVDSSRNQAWCRCFITRKCYHIAYAETRCHHTRFNARHCHHQIFLAIPNNRYFSKNGKATEASILQASFDTFTRMVRRL